MITQLSRFALFLSLTGMLFLACGDDDGPEDPTSDLVGVWTVNSVSFTCPDPSLNDEEIYPCNAQECTTLEFTSNGEYIVRETFDGDEGIERGTYTISGNTVTIRVDTEVDILTWSISGNTVTLNVADNEDGCEATLTGTRQ